MKELEADVVNLIDVIKQSDIYKKYLHILSQLEASMEINSLINEIKALQKEAVNEEYLSHKEAASKLDKAIEKKLCLLNSIPLYIDYIEISNELNEQIVSIKQEIEANLNDII